MPRLNFTKPEIAYIKSKIYLSAEDEKILDLWLLEWTTKEIASEMSMSTSTVFRRKEKILAKIMKVF